MQARGSNPLISTRGVEQWLARQIHYLEVGGSNPPPAIVAEVAHMGLWRSWERA